MILFQLRCAVLFMFRLGEGSTSESSLDATPQCESTLLFGKDDAIVSESNTLAVGEANSAGSQQEREIV